MGNQLEKQAVEVCNAARKDDYAFIVAALQKGYPIETSDPMGMKAIHAAAEGGAVKVVMLLMQRGCMIDARGGSDGLTPLHLACRESQANIVSILLDRGADVHAVTYTTKNTPLHFAAQAGHRQICQLLISLHAKISVKNTEGKTPIQMATGSAIAFLKQLKAQADEKELNSSVDESDPSALLMTQRVAELEETLSVIENDKKIIEKRYAEIVDEKRVLEERCESITRQLDVLGNRAADAQERAVKAYARAQKAEERVEELERLIKLLQQKRNGEVDVNSITNDSPDPLTTSDTNGDSVITSTPTQLHKRRISSTTSPLGSIYGSRSINKYANEEDSQL